MMIPGLLKLIQEADKSRRSIPLAEIERQRKIVQEIAKKNPRRPVPAGREMIIFADGECPKCGIMCGNGGQGPLKCECGWVGEDMTEKMEWLAGLAFKHDEEDQR